MNTVTVTAAQRYAAEISDLNARAEELMYWLSEDNFRLDELEQEDLDGIITTAEKMCERYREFRRLSTVD